MKKTFIIILLLINMLLLHPMSRPKKNEKAGAVTGRIHMTLENKKNNDLNKRYYSFTLLVENLMTKNLYPVVSSSFGYYYILHLPPGIYRIKSFTFEENEFEMIYSLENVSLEKIKFTIQDHTITVIPTIVVTTEFLTHPKYGSKKVKLKISLKNEHKKIIKYFKEKDKRGKWKNFQFITLKESLK